MNTILISGTAKCIDVLVQYDVWIWAQQNGKEFQFITAISIMLPGHAVLWSYVKNYVIGYYADMSFNDGAHTNFLEHLIAKQ